jgi:hypothetical protein
MDPEQVILDDLAQPPGQLELGPTGAGGWRAGTVSGGGLHRAELGSVRSVKHRESSRRRVDFVTFHGSIPMFGDDEHEGARPLRPRLNSTRPKLAHRLRPGVEMVVARRWRRLA